MSEILLTLLILALASATYFLWIKPVKAMKSYAKFLRNKGYKVYEIPYNPLRNHMVASIQKGLSKGDAMGFYKQAGA